MKLQAKKGFSLIEVLVFITIMSLVFITAAGVVSVSLRNLKVNEHKIMATRYGQELLEWFKEQKEINWGNFYGQASGGTYCFNNDSILTDPTPTWPGTGACSQYNGITGDNITYPDFYKREAILERQGATQVNITVTVSWQEAGTTYSVPLNSSVTEGD